MNIDSQPLGLLDGRAMVSEKAVVMAKEHWNSMEEIFSLILGELVSHFIIDH